METENNVYAAPETDVEVKSESDSSHLASRVKRLGAAIIDSLIGGIVSLPILFLTGGFAAVMPVVSDDGTVTAAAGHSLGYTLGMSIVGIIIFFAIHSIWLFSKGQTIGKLILKIKIVKADSSALEKGDIFKRYGFYFIIGLVPFYIGSVAALVNVCFIFRKDQRCLHDLVGKTIVVNE